MTLIAYLLNNLIDGFLKIIHQLRPGGVVLSDPRPGLTVAPDKDSGAYRPSQPPLPKPEFIVIEYRDGQRSAPILMPAKTPVVCVNVEAPGGYGQLRFSRTDECVIMEESNTLATIYR